MERVGLPVRFRPVPPAKVEIRNIKILGSEWNLSMSGIPERGAIEL